MIEKKFALEPNNATVLIGIFSTNQYAASILGFQKSYTGYSLDNEAIIVQTFDDSMEDGSVQIELSLHHSKAAYDKDVQDSSLGNVILLETHFFNLDRQDNEESKFIYATNDFTFLPETEDCTSFPLPANFARLTCAIVVDKKFAATKIRAIFALID